MSRRDATQVALRQLADLRLASREIEYELCALKREQSDLDRQIDLCLHVRTQTPRRRFWRGFGKGVFVVCAVWMMAFCVAQLAVGF